MSQHSYKYNELNVLAGWDRPMANLFLIVKNETSNIPIYDNTTDPKANDAQDTDHYQEMLRILRIPVPDGFWNAIESDRSENKGNSLTCWELS